MEEKKKDELEEQETNESEDLTEEQKEALKELEEELVKMLEKQQLEDDRKTFRLLFSYGLHNNFIIHSLLMLVVNIVGITTIIGLTNLGIIVNLPYYFLSIILFTVVEINIRLLIYRFFPKALLRSIGTINLIYIIPLFYLTIVYLGEIHFNEIWHSIIVLLGFIVIRIFITYYIKAFNSRRKK